MAESHHLGYGHAGNPDLPQHTPNFFEYEWLDDGDAAFHCIAPGCRIVEGGGLGFAPRGSE